MYGLELNVKAGIKHRAGFNWTGIKCMGWNKIYGVEFNLQAGIKCKDWKRMYRLELKELEFYFSACRKERLSVF